MEDQQPAAGDLTVDAPLATDVTEAAEVDATQSDGATSLAESEAGDSEKSADDATESAEVGSEESDADAAEEADKYAGPSIATLGGKKKTTEKARRTRTKKPRRTRTKPLIGKRTAIAIAVAVSLLFVGSAAFAGATMQAYLHERATVATKLNVARTAANAVTTLWSYTPENMDTLADRAANYLSGDFAAQYRKFVDAIVAPNKQAKVSNNTQVTAAAVEWLEGPNAIAIVYTNTTSTTPLKKNIPALQYLSYRVMLKRDHGRWMVTRMTTVTSLNLTPHL